MKLVIRRPWELGYGVKRIVEGADFEFSISAAGWTGDMRVSLPRPDFDDVQLGDEVEVVDDDGKVWWAGKVVRQEFGAAYENEMRLTVRGLCEFAYDLPVDCLLLRRSGRTSVGLSQLWETAVNIARQTWSRLIAQNSDTIVTSVPMPVDLRGKTLGDMWRFVQNFQNNLNFDVFIAPQLLSSPVFGRLNLPIKIRSSTPLVIPKQRLSNWELSYDATQVVNYLLAQYRPAIAQNLLPDPSFENLDNAAWGISGSGTYSVIRRQVSIEERPWFSHGTLLEITLQPNASVTLATLKEVSLAGNTNYWMEIWTNASATGVTLKAYIGSSQHSYVANLPVGWAYSYWIWNVPQEVNLPVKFVFTNTSSSTVTVLVDHAVLAQGNSASIEVPLLTGSTEEGILSSKSVFAVNKMSRILSVVYQTGSVYRFWAYTNPTFTADDVGKTVEIWQWGKDNSVAAIWRGYIYSLVNESVVDIAITDNPLGVPVTDAVGGVLRIVDDSVRYGTRIGLEVFSSPEEAQGAMLALASPKVSLTATVVDFPDIIVPDRDLVVPEFADIRPSFPIQQVTVSVRGGEVVAQQIDAGDLAISWRGFLRRLQKSLREYSQTR